MSDGSLKGKAVRLAGEGVAAATGVEEVAIAGKIAGRLIGVGKRRENKISEEPPPVMTWSKASPILVVVVLFWFLRVFFEGFLFFGPALAALGCTVVVNHATGASTTYIGGKIVATACTGVAAAIGVLGSETIEPFGVVMAMIVGILGWIVVGLLILLTNQRVFKEDPQITLWLLGALGFDELPLIGALPGLTTAVFRTYHKQIQNDKKILAEYEASVQTQKEQQRAEQIAQANQFQALQQEQEAANDAEYAAQEEAANDAEYTQEFDQAA